MALLEGRGQMKAQSDPRGRKSLIAIAVAVLFLFNLNVALAADSGLDLPSPSPVTASSASSSFISGYVWYDDDGDEILDQIEGGLEGVAVYLYRDNDGALISTKISSQDGSYQFSELEAGGYIVQVAETVTLGLAKYALTTGSPLHVSLEEGDGHSSVNFGYEGVASPAGPAPTAVVLSSFAASSASQAVSSWPELAFMATLAMGGALWTRRR